MPAPPRLAVEQTAEDALAEYVEDLTNAWKEDPEFNNALHLAVVIEHTKYLKEYLASSKPLTRGNRRSLAGYIDLLERRIALLQKRPRGRPRRKPDKARAADRAERNATWVVAFAQKKWREQHGRERVPAAVTSKMIGDAIEEAARAFSVPVNKINAGNIRSALKTGRIIVP